MHKIQIWVLKDLHNFVLYIVDEAAAIHAWNPFYSSGYFSSSAMQKWWGNDRYIISLSENWTLIQEKMRSDIFHNQIHYRIKFNFYGSISPCLSFRNVDGEEEELSVCLPDFNHQSMIEMETNSCSGAGVCCNAVRQLCLHRVTAASPKAVNMEKPCWHRKEKTTFCDSVLPSENIFSIMFGMHKHLNVQNSKWCASYLVDVLVL